MTKTNYCTTNNAIGYYPLDSYGYNTILINGTESIGYDDYVYFTFSHYLNTLKNQALPERKSIVSGKVLGLRLTALPLTIDSKSSETPILWDRTND